MRRGFFQDFGQQDVAVLRRYSASSAPHRPPSLVIRDEILEYYAWVFCQGGFANFGLSFEHFLTVVAEMWPSQLHPGNKG